MSKKQKLILLTITLSLILLSVGLSFAFFSTINNNESSSTLYAKGGTMTIKYANGSGNIIVENIYPKKDAWVNKVFTVTGNNSTELDMDYRVYLVTKSNGFNYGDLTYSISGTSTNSSDTLVQKANQNVPKSGEILIGKGTFKSNTATHSYNLRIFYKETGENQNNGQEKNYTGFVRIATGNDLGVDSLISQDKNGSPDSSVFNGPIIKNEVESITFKTNTTVPSNAIISWDASDSQNGSVMAYTLDTNNNNLYELYIGQDKKIVLGSNASHMFQGYNKTTTLDVSNFDTSNVTTMEEMFAGSTITTISGLEKWNTSKVTTMRSMFNNSKITSLDLSSFDTSNVTDMFGMFYDSSATEIKGLSNFNTSKVTHMGMMFRNSRAKELDLSSFNTSKVTTMSFMFYFCDVLELDVSSFNTINVNEMSSMFRNTVANKITGLENFNTSNVTNMNDMFSGSKALTLDLSGFNTSKVKTMYGMFFNSAATEIKDLNTFDTSNVTQMGDMFKQSKAESIDVSSFNTSKVTNMQGMFSDTKVKSLNLTGFDTSSVTTMAYMFQNMKNITTLDLSSFDTSKVTQAYSMFSDNSATIGYARTQADSNFFNATSEKPSGLTFTVKQ